MEILRASELESRHLGEHIIVPLVWGEDGKAVEVERGELVAFNAYVGNVALIIGKGQVHDRVTLDVSPDTEVRIDLA